MKTAICAIIKNEHKFIKEWADYHFGIGIDYIQLFEDYGSDSHEDIFKGYDNVNIIPLTNNTLGIKDYHNSHTQYKTYEYYLNYVKDNDLFDWVLFTDVDEFLMFEEGYDLNKLLSEYEDYAGIYLSWKYYGANGHIKSPEGGVLENYTKPSPEGCRCDRQNQWQLKSFVNIKKAERFIHIHAIEGGVHTNGDPSIHSEQCYDKAWLNHYYSKSWEDYVYRMCSRGNMSNNYRTFDTFFDINPDMLDKEEELIESVRYLHTVSTFWISKKYGIISGGNQLRLKEIKEKLMRNLHL